MSAIFSLPISSLFPEIATPEFCVSNTYRTGASTAPLSCRLLAIFRKLGNLAFEAPNRNIENADPTTFQMHPPSRKFPLFKKHPRSRKTCCRLNNSQQNDDRLRLQLSRTPPLFKSESNSTQPNAGRFSLTRTRSQTATPSPRRFHSRAFLVRCKERANVRTGTTHPEQLYTQYCTSCLWHWESGAHKNAGHTPPIALGSYYATKAFLSLTSSCRTKSAWINFVFMLNCYTFSHPLYPFRAVFVFSLIITHFYSFGFPIS